MWQIGPHFWQTRVPKPRDPRGRPRWRLGKGSEEMRWLGGPFPGAGARSPQPAPRVGPPLQAGCPRAVPAPPPPHPAGRVRPAPAAPGPEPRSALLMHKTFGGLQGVFEILAEAASPPGSHTAPTVELGGRAQRSPRLFILPPGPLPARGPLHPSGVDGVTGLYPIQKAPAGGELHEFFFPFYYVFLARC